MTDKPVSKENPQTLRTTSQIPITRKKASSETISIYERIGGEPTFDILTRKFYEKVAQDPVLAQMYGPENLEPARERLKLFLMQYWGGPEDYSALRGHPRLRMRHNVYTISTDEKDRWLHCMHSALHFIANKVSKEDMDALVAYFNDAAQFLQNSPSL